MTEGPEIGFYARNLDQELRILSAPQHTAHYRRDFRLAAAALDRDDQEAADFWFDSARQVAELLQEQGLPHSITLRLPTK